MCAMISQLSMSSHDQMYFTIDKTVCLGCLSSSFWEATSSSSEQQERAC